MFLYKIFLARFTSLARKNSLKRRRYENFKKQTLCQEEIEESKMIKAIKQKIIRQEHSEEEKTVINEIRKKKKKKKR